MRVFMKSIVSDNFDRVSATGPFFVTDVSKSTAHCTEKAFQKKDATRSAREVDANLLIMLETDFTRSFVSLLKDLDRELCLQPLQDIQLEFIKS